MLTVVDSKKYCTRRLFYVVTAGAILLSLCSLPSSNNPTQAAVAAPAQRDAVQHTMQLDTPATSARHTQGLGANASTTTSYYYNWSGYVATATKPYIAVRSVYVQPAVTCTVPGAWTVFWVGLDGYTNGTVEQAGTAAQCGTSKHTLSYYAWWEMYPTNTIQTMPITIKPGDRVEDTVLYNVKNGQYNLTVSDLTNTRQHYTKVTKCAVRTGCARQTAEWIVERPTLSNGRFSPLANWKSMQLTTDVAANTSAVDRRTKILAPVLKPISAFPRNTIYMVDDPNTGKNLATVSPLSTSGSVFTDTWAAAR